MITKARIQALNTAEDGTPLEGENANWWITALRSPAIKKLMADGGPLQMSLFDQQDLAEISHPDYPGERLVACRNPALAADRARKREELLAATERLLAPHRPRAGREADRSRTDRGRRRQGNQPSTTPASTCRPRSPIPASPSPGGRPRSTRKPRSTGSTCCTPPSPKALPAPAVVTAYKNLKYVERDFRHIKSDDLDLRPVLTRNDVHFAGATTTLPMLAEPTSAQREAFDLIGATLPLTLK
jgi:hypothetical protein